MNKYYPYIGAHEYIIGKTVFVRTKSGYARGKVIEYIFPKRGIIGTYKIKIDNGKTTSTTTIYIEKEATT